MKKVISLLVALATAAGVSATAFAADDFPGTIRQSNRGFDDGVTGYAAVLGESQTSIGAKELFLVDSTSKVVGGVYNRMDPDSEYKMQIYYNPNDFALEAGTDADIIAQARMLTGEDLGKGTIRLRTLKGSSNVQSAKIKTIGRNNAAKFELVINTREYYGTKINDVEYSLNVTGSDRPIGYFAESSHTFEVGWDSIDDSETDIGEDGYVTISNDAPVVLKEQFSDIAKSTNYKAARFEGEDGDWTFTGRVSGMGDSNLYHNYDVLPQLVNKFPDQDYKFLNFKAGVNFPSQGEMRISADDIDEFDNMYVYMYRNGKLTTVNATYDTGANELVFRTNYLGTFVVTNTKITDTTIVDDNDNDIESETDSSKPDDNKNPSTGAESITGVAVTLALASLVSAAAVSRKKRK